MTNNLLFHGLRPQPNDKEAWCELVTEVIRQKWVAIPNSSSTRKTESRLGITGRPLYFFAMRSEHAFGFVVFALRLKVQPDPHVFGATPFDSGGMWKGKVWTARNLREPAKRQLFQNHDVQLSNFPREFERYMEANYSDITDYVEGRPPVSGTPPIIPRFPNSSRAWTWEVRIPRSVTSTWAELVGGFITPTAMSEYSDWLAYDSTVEDAEAEYIHRWTSTKMQLAPPGVSAHAFAQESLLAGEIA